jgi:hypothetical protein
MRRRWNNKITDTDSVKRKRKEKKSVFLKHVIFKKIFFQTTSGKEKDQKKI